MNVLKKHVSFPDADKVTGAEGGLFNKILRLKTGEALVFAPSAIVRRPTKNEDDEGGDVEQDWTTAANELIRVRVRKRVTWDGGASIVCV